MKKNKKKPKKNKLHGNVPSTCEIISELHVCNIILMLYNIIPSNIIIHTLAKQRTAHLAPRELSPECTTRCRSRWHW